MSWRIFLFGWTSGKKKREVSAPKMCFIKMCIHHTLDACTTNWCGTDPASSPLPSQGYQYKRKIQGTQIFPFVAFIRPILIWLPKLATGAVSQQHSTNFCEQGLEALSPVSEERHVSMRDTGSLLDTDTPWLSPSSISNLVTSSCVLPLFYNFTHSCYCVCCTSDSQIFQFQITFAE